MLKKEKHEYPILECPKCGQTDYEIIEVGTCLWHSPILAIGVHGNTDGWRDTETYDFERTHFECTKCMKTFGGEDLANANWI